MKVLSKKIENQTAYFTLAAEPAEMEEHMNNAYRRMVYWAPIPGFDKGKAPREVLEKYMGHDALVEEANIELVPRLYARALKDNELDAIGEPTAKITQKEPLVFDLVAPLKPIVEIGDYRSIRLPPEKPGVATEKDVQTVLESIQRRFVDYIAVDRPSQLGDVLTIDIDSTILGSPFINGKGRQFIVSKDYPPGIPEFHKYFVGLKRDEQKEFKITLPQNYINEAMAGKEASFKVKVIDIYEEKIPELCDSLAQLAAPDLKTMDALRERIFKNLKLDCEEKARIVFEEKLMATLIEKSKLAVSPVVIEAETESMMQEGLKQLEDSCENKEDYQYKLQKLPKDEVRERYRALVTKRILWNLVLTVIAKKEGIDVSEDEIEKEIEKMIQGVSLRDRAKQNKAMKAASYQENIKALISARKTIALLTEIASAP